MARKMKKEDTDIFRLEMQNQYGTYYEGPYTTLGATKARMSWHRNMDLMVIQQLGISDENELEWFDIEAFRKAS